MRKVFCKIKRISENFLWWDGFNSVQTRLLPFWKLLKFCFIEYTLFFQSFRNTFVICISETDTLYSHLFFFQHSMSENVALILLKGWTILDSNWIIILLMVVPVDVRKKRQKRLHISIYKILTLMRKHYFRYLLIQSETNYINAIRVYYHILMTLLKPKACLWPMSASKIDIHMWIQCV